MKIFISFIVSIVIFIYGIGLFSNALSKMYQKRAVSNAELKAFETTPNILILVNAEKPAKS